MAKRRLKGTKVVITELTKRRIDLLNRAKGLRNVNTAWTSDGRIICLLGNGRKVSIGARSHKTSGGIISSTVRAASLLQ